MKEITKQLETTEIDRDRLLEDITQNGSYRRQLEETRTLLDRDIIKLESKTENLEQSLIQKEETILNMKQLNDTNEERRELLNKQLLNYQNTIDVLQDKLITSSNELQRGNIVIAKYQNENRQFKEKLMNKTEVIRKQELIVKQSMDKINDLQRELMLNNNNYNELTQKSLQLQHLLDEANTTINKLKEQISEQEKVILFLSHFKLYSFQLYLIVVFFCISQMISYLNEEQNKWQLGFSSSVSNKTTNRSGYQNHQQNYNSMIPIPNIVTFSPEMKTPETYTNYQYNNDINDDHMNHEDIPLNIDGFEDILYPTTNMNTDSSNNNLGYTYDNVKYSSIIEKKPKSNGIEIGSDLSQIPYYATPNNVSVGNSIKSSSVIKPQYSWQTEEFLNQPIKGRQ